MSKAILPNIPGHYEMSGFEIDVTSTQIIVRHAQQENRPQRKPEQRQYQDKKEDEQVFGPITRKILGPLLGGKKE